MLTDALKQDIRNGLAAIAAGMPNFKSRAGQRMMIAEIAKAFALCPQGKIEPAERIANTGATFVCINGGTGIGKSLAYCLAGSIVARQREKKLVIASSTVALQEQLVQKDIPLFLSAAGLAMKTELAKGRTRFVCEYKLIRVVEDMKQVRMFDDHLPSASCETPSTGNETLKFLDDMLTDFHSKKWNGDRDSREHIDDALWASVTTDRYGCLSRLCPCQKTCAQADARQRIKTADIIVANHDLVLSDLACGGNILPKPEECLYVFDEAHHLPEKAVASFASNHLLASSRRMLERLDGFLPALTQALPGDPTKVVNGFLADTETARSGLSDAFNYFTGLQQLVPTKETPRPMIEFERSMVPEEFVSIGGNILGATRKLLGRLDLAYELITNQSGDKSRSRMIEKILGDLGVYCGRIESILNTWEMFLDEPDIERPPIAKWVAAIPGGDGRDVDYQICASPVMSSGYLKKMLWERAAGAVLCSATITTLGNFNDFLSRSGLCHFPDTSCVDLPSPFDYGAQGVLVIPAMKATPKDVAKHTSEVLETVAGEIDLLQGEGMLVLFTSRRQMEEVARQLPEKLLHLVQVQGESPKTGILAEHRARIDRGEASVIFGLESFSEGVDLVGRYCTLLVITKLPFQAPDDPVLKSLSDWVDRRGGNSFMEISVPNAARKLEQRVGRLIRSESDNGRVMVLDTRLWTTRFGRSILRGLPPFRVMAMGKEVHP